MAREALTAEQRQAYKTRAYRVQEILDLIERLEGWREVDLDGRERFIHCTFDRELATRAWLIGIDTLIAQLEQELADLDRQPVARQWPVPERLPGCGGDNLSDSPRQSAHESNSKAWDLSQPAPKSTPIFAPTSRDCRGTGEPAKSAHHLPECICDVCYPTIPATLSDAEELADYACKVCGNCPDETGRREHGRGCYTQSEDGGGCDYVEFEQPTKATP